jgi:hypothetical protein
MPRNVATSRVVHQSRGSGSTTQSEYSAYAASSRTAPSGQITVTGMPSFSASATTSAVPPYPRAGWPSHTAYSRAGLGELHFHDLRHTGNQLAAGTGATLRELMDRMGHSTARAALIYLHGSDQRQREIAQALSERAEAELKRHAKRAKGQDTRKASGT